MSRKTFADTPQIKFTTDSLSELTACVEQEFLSRYSRSPEFIVAAPGRVNLIGDHIDYNDGFVLPMAVERYVGIAAAFQDEHAGQRATFYSANFEESATIPLNRDLEPRTNGWVRYVEGVVSGFKDLNVTIPSFDAVIRSSVPVGGGISSSAALEVATATLLEALTETRLDPAEKSLLCQQAEHRFAGVPCGIMDQFSSVFGKPNELMFLDCRSKQIQSVSFASDDITVLIANSNVRHELTGGQYAERRNQCESALAKLKQSTWRTLTMDHLESERVVLSTTEYRRARHVVSEIARTVEAAKAFQGGDWARLGELMYASHASLREDYEVSCEELDILVELAREIGEAGGVVGSRMTGGGFGGCTVSLVRTENVKDIMRSLDSQYQAKTGIKPHIFSSRPARGAHVIRARALGDRQC